MSSLTDKEVKEYLKKNEENLTLRFNTCLVLLKEIQHVVKNATNTLKNVCLLHKTINFVISISDKDDDVNREEKHEEKYNEEVTHFDNIDDEDEQGQEATKEDAQDIEETNTVKIIAVVIASLPHSPSKIFKTPSSEIASARLIVTSTESASTQSIFAPVHLSTSLIKVASTSSIKQQALPSTSILATSGISTIVISTMSAISTF